MEPFSLGTDSGLQPRHGGRATLRADDAIQRAGFIDLHQDMLVGVGLLDGGFPDYGSNYLTGSSHAAAVWSSIYPHTPDASLLSQLEALSELLSSHSSSLRLITTVDDLYSEDRRTGVLPHSEGFHLPAIEPETLDRLWAEHSLRSLSLTWNYETEYGFSCYEDPTAPLKPAGRRLLVALAGSPLFLDLAHLNDAGFYEALDIYAPPVLVTHTFCRGIVDHPRGLSDEQLRALGRHGGLVGLAFFPEFLGRQGSIDEALRHIDRIATLAGEDAVSIGSDWGVADMGELGDPAGLAGLVDAVGRTYGSALADKFAFANAYDFLRGQLPLS
jgi:membrane dipeptidase